MGLNFFAAQGCLCDGDADAFLYSVVVFVVGQIEKIFGQFVIARDNIFERDIFLKLFDLKGIKNSFVSFIHENQPPKFFLLVTVGSLC